MQCIVEALENEDRSKGSKIQRTKLPNQPEHGRTDQTNLNPTPKSQPNPKQNTPKRVFKSSKTDLHLQAIPVGASWIPTLHPHAPGPSRLSMVVKAACVVVQAGWGGDRVCGEVFFFFFFFFWCFLLGLS